jgi:hypothetical protein
MCQNPLPFFTDQQKSISLSKLFSSSAPHSKAPLDSDSVFLSQDALLFMIQACDPDPFCIFQMDRILLRQTKE